MYKINKINSIIQVLCFWRFFIIITLFTFSNFFGIVVTLNPQPFFFLVDFQLVLLDSELLFLFFHCFSIVFTCFPTLSYVRNKSAKYVNKMYVSISMQVDWIVRSAIFCRPALYKLLFDFCRTAGLLNIVCQ